MAEISAVEARTLLARAFVHDPLMVWFFPDDDARPHACAAMFGVFAEHYLADGRVDVVRCPEPVAVAMWQWPSEQGGTAARSDELPTIGGLMTAFMGAGRAREVGATMKGMEDLRPAEPHAYLHQLGVHPGARGRGFGGRLLDRGIADARSAGLVACLDTTNPANVPYYEAHGLSVRHEFPLGADGPTVWAMATG
ncbi:GNAT family N-acetyltransferase [Blastococcus haudaquaticus]|uniref:Acetyltransferase (GNAT) family protein n=1 Tax=Blastococcus haudaquaticus TaxID=1938745 RepID=A0A286H4V9_9ACTN|nr:GNAT family N-acetyltransferase [Blastococcus haudaquaticus]SOE02828.1 Acetyltransferase (GNAT) family protein [Blastococcus haudaquaticus]